MMKEVSVIGHPSFDIKSIDLEYVVEHLGEVSFSKIIMDPSLSLPDRDLLLTMTDSNNPVTIGDDLLVGNFLGFDSKYYEDNKQEIQSRLVTICKNIDSTYFSLNSEFINDEIIEALSQNTHIKHLRLGTEENGYTLTSAHYEVLKNSTIESIKTFAVSDELKDIFGQKIKNNDDRYLIGNLTYESISSKDEWTLEKSLSDEEIEYLKYSKEGASFKFEKYDDFDNIFKIINRLDGLGKKDSFIIRVQSENSYNNKNRFNEYLFSHVDLLDKDITIMVGINEEYSLKDYVSYEKRLVEMVRPALNMSPFEKYLFAYNIVKKYKKYKENEENKDQSRHLYEILDGDYMVCVGYAKLLGDLLNKLGIDSKHYGVSVEIGLDKVANDALVLPDDVLTQDAGHARLEVHLVDPKYGIDGIYLADPTWDNDMEHDTYNYSLMTQDEYNGINRYNFLFFYDVEELFFIHSLDEFYQKVNIWIDKNISRDSVSIRRVFTNNMADLKNNIIEFLAVVQKNKPEKFEEYKKILSYVTRHIGTADSKNKMSIIDEEVNDDKTLADSFKELSRTYDSCCYNKNNMSNIPLETNKRLLTNLRDSIKFIDPEKYDYFFNKYKELQEYRFIPSTEYIQQFLLEFGEYLLSKVNKPVTGEQFRDAITEVYRASGLEGEELEAKVNEVIEYNKERQQKAFPTRYNVLDDGTKIPVLNEVNKFDLEKGRKLVA